MGTKNRPVRLLVAFLSLFTLLGVVTPAQAVSTLFIESARTLSGVGAWEARSFTLSRRTTLVLRFASDAAAQCAVIPPSQYAAFTSNRSFQAHVLFDRQIGTKFITLNAGSYYVGVRNGVSGANTCRYELDLDIVVPGSRFAGFGPNEARFVGANGGRLWHPFTVQSGRRYFLDGANSGLESYVIPASQLANFRSGATFLHYTSYGGSGLNLPGLVELQLPPGEYCLAFLNRSGTQRGVVYTIEIYSGGPTNPAPTPPSVPPSRPPTNPGQPTLPPSWDDGFEDNDTFGAVRARVPGPFSPDFGRITSAKSISSLRLMDGNDWYAFTLTRTGGSAAEVSVSVFPANRRMIVDVYTPSLTRISRQVVGVGSGTVRISLRGQRAGRYFIRITDERLGVPVLLRNQSTYTLRLVP